MYTCTIMIENSPNFKRRLAKRQARYDAFMFRFNPGYSIRPSAVKTILSGMIEDHERQHVPRLQHNIGRREVGHYFDRMMYKRRKKLKKSKR